MAQQYKELPGWTAAAPADAAPKGDWWTSFHDPLLDELEPMVAVSNQTVRQNYDELPAGVAEVKLRAHPVVSNHRTFGIGDPVGRARLRW